MVFLRSVQVTMLLERPVMKVLPGIEYTLIFVIAMVVGDGVPESKAG